MNNGWEIVKIEDLFEVKNGASIQSRDFTGNKKDESFMEVLKIGHIAVGGGLRTEPKKDYVKKTPKLEKFILRKGDIVMAMTDMKDNVKILGVPAMVDKNNKYILNQRVGCLRKKETIDFDAKFVYYQMRTRRYLLPLQMQANRGVQVNLTTDHIKNSIVYLPPLAEQKRISSILSSLDSKIENNRKICANLEAQAQALFKHWFVDFAPFKDGKFVESELGMIPEGWRVGKLGDVTEFLNGFAFKSSSFVSKGKYKVITIKAVQDGKLITDSADEIEDLSLNIPSHCVLKIGDILLSLTGNVGRVCIVTQDNLVLNQRVCILNPRNLIDRGYVYTLSRTKLLKTRMINIAKGTAQANLSPVETSKLSIVVPPRYILDKFGIIANEYMSEIISASQENQRLSSLRDTLLPKLMSGEIKV